MAIIKEGFLKKQGHSWHTWKQRWFVLSSDQTLKYYVKQNDANPIGVIDISKASFATAVKKTAFGTLISHLFSVQASEGSSQGRTFTNRVYYFQGKTDSEVQEWLQALKDAQKRPAPVTKTDTKAALPVSKKRIVLVSGATGNVGQHVVEELAKKKDIVIRAGTRDPSKQSFSKLGVELVEINYSKPETIDKAMQDVDTLFLLTTGPTMVEDSLKLIEHAKKAKSVQYIVKLGGINPNHPSFVLGKMHLAIENAVKNSGIQYALLRPNSFHQNIGAFFSQSIKSGQDIYCAFGDKAKVAYVDTRDIGAVAAEVISRQNEFQGKTIDLNGSESLDHHQIAASISKVIGRTVKYIDLPPEHWKAIVKGYGLSEPFIDALISLYDEYKAGRVGTVSNEVEQILKRKPITFEQYVRDYVYQFAPEPRKVLVLGSTGNVGVETIKSLVTKSGIKVLAATRNPERANYFRYLGAEPIEFDVQKPVTIEKALEGVHTLFLLNTFSPFMLEEATTILDAVKKIGTVKYIVKLSGIKAEHPSFTLGKIHVEIENKIKETVSEWAFLRPNSFHQNMGNFFGTSIQNGGDIYSAFGNESKVSYVDSRDVGAVAAEMLARPQDFNGKVISLNGESLDHHQMAAIISEQIGRQVKYIDIPDEDYRKAMKGYGFPDVMIDIMLNLYKEYQSGRHGETSKEIEEILGRKPTSFKQYVQDHVHVFTKRPPVRILVTGATGNIGSRVARSLLFNSSNSVIRVAVRNAERASSLRELGAEIAVVDHTKPETLDKALEGVDRLVLIPPFSEEMPVVAHAWVESAKRSQVKLIVKTGGAGSDNRLFPMSKWHDDNEVEIMKSGISYVFLRPTFVFSNFTNQIAAIKETGLFYQSFGNGAVSFLDPRDYAEVLNKVVSASDPSPHLGNIYTITGSKAITCYDIAESLSKVLSREVKYVILSEQEAFEGMTNSGTPEVLAKGLAALTNVAPTGGLAFVSPALEQILGRKGYEFENFVRQFIESETPYVPKYRIAVLGTGDVGRVLGAGLIRKGHQVFMGSRDATNEKATKWVSENGKLAKNGTFEDAANFAEIIVLATSWEGTENALKLAGSGLKGKIIIDATNPLHRSANGVELAVGHTTSGGELVQSWAPESKVIKAFNIVGNAHMVDPDFIGGPPDMWIAGNDDASKKLVKKFIESLGWNVVDGGDIKFSRYLEPLAMVWITYFLKNKDYNHAFKLLKKN